MMCSAPHAADHFPSKVWGRICRAWAEEPFQRDSTLEPTKVWSAHSSPCPRPPSGQSSEPRKAD